MIAPVVSVGERVEQVLFDLLHSLSVADMVTFALVERALDPDGSTAQVFAACHLRHELQQARAAIERAQQRVAQAVAVAEDVQHPIAPNG